MNAEAVLARSGRTFHLASRLLPSRMRADAAELYAFCRRMDDWADNGEPEGRERLQAAIAALEHDPLGDEAAAAGWPVALERDFPGIGAVAVVLTRALAADAGPRRIATERELQKYAFGVAGTVGLMMCRILHAPPQAAAAASHLGIAMQMTNIARDVAEDRRRDRVYLPDDWIAPAEVDAALEGRGVMPLLQATQRLLTFADKYYASADAGMPYLPLRARIAILAATACYREIGSVVLRDVSGSWRHRAVVPGRRKAALVLRAFIAAPFQLKKNRAESNLAPRVERLP